MEMHTVMRKLLQAVQAFQLLKAAAKKGPDAPFLYQCVMLVGTQSFLSTQSVAHPRIHEHTRTLAHVLTHQHIQTHTHNSAGACRCPQPQ